MLSFSPQFPNISVLADELKEFYTPLSAKEGEKTSALEICLSELG